ncbi:GSU2403 family nucleotidyltransferase fold protein [Endothiovibrio diazotrophicus]
MLDAPLRLPLIARAGAVLANVPDPARYVLHKLIVSTIRDPSRRDKAIKDLAQAEAILQVMIDTLPGEVGAAWRAMAPHGDHFLEAVRRGVQRLEGRSPKLAAEVASEMARA